MKQLFAIVCLCLFLVTGLIAQSQDKTTSSEKKNSVYGNLDFGDFSPGLSVEEITDPSRITLDPQTNLTVPRTIRMYTWYPSEDKAQETLSVKDYLELAGDDFPDNVHSKDQDSIWLPVLLRDGMDNTDLAGLLLEETRTALNARPADGRFPLLVLGQGLYYESPFTHFILCEYLAGHGYVVVSSPLLGTDCRLVNITPRDVETQIRDMEVLMAKAAEKEYIDNEHYAVAGYDLGGISGLLMVMRHPEADAFLSLDCSILYSHPSGLPDNHFNYDETRFNIPWLHITQSGWVQEGKTQGLESLFDRKNTGDSYLMTFPTENHGSFTSYARLGIDRAVPAYWNNPAKKEGITYVKICETVLKFLNAYMKDSAADRDELMEMTGNTRDTAYYSMEFRKGEKVSISEAPIINEIIEKGIPYPSFAADVYDKEDLRMVLTQDKLLWLGYHLFFWWGREYEAVELFKHIMDLYPGSIEAIEPLAQFGHFTVDNNGELYHTFQDSTIQQAGLSLFRLEIGNNTVLASIGKDGVLLCDAGSERESREIKAALQKLRAFQPDYIIDTHWHEDHSGGNIVFGKSAVIIAHKNVRNTLSEDRFLEYWQEEHPAYPVAGLPDIVFDDSLSIHFNGERIDLIALSPGHTNGDIIVFFRESNVIHVGDCIFSNGFPAIDFETGGSVEGFAENLTAIMHLIDEDSRVITGHGPDCDLAFVRDYQEMILSSIEIVKKAIQSGKSLEEMKSEGILNQWEKYSHGFFSCEQWTEMVYYSLKKHPFIDQ